MKNSEFAKKAQIPNCAMWGCTEKLFTTSGSGKPRLWHSTTFLTQSKFLPSPPLSNISWRQLLPLPCLPNSSSDSRFFTQAIFTCVHLFIYIPHHVLQACCQLKHCRWNKNNEQTFEHVFLCCTDNDFSHCVMSDTGNQLYLFVGGYGEGFQQLLHDLSGQFLWPIYILQVYTLHCVRALIIHI